MANKLTAELVLDINRFRRGIRDAQNRTRRAFSGNQGSSAGSAFGGGIAKGIIKSGALVTAGLVAVLTVAASVAALKAGKTIAQAIKEAGENERFQMRFEVLTGSRGAGNRMLDELREDAMRTGVALSDMADNVGKFIAFGFDPKGAMDLQRGILDVGGAVGLTTRDMKLLGVALSQVAAKGVANMEELRQQIAEKGIPIFKALEQRLGVTGAELNKMVQEGKVSAEDVLSLFTDISKGEGPFAKFAGGADKMATTFPGLIERIKRTWEEFLRVLGDPVIDAIKPMLNGMLTNMDALLAKAKDWGVILADAATAIYATLSVLGQMDWSVIANLFRTAMDVAIKQVGNLIYRIFRGAVGFFIQYFIEGVKNVIALIGILSKPAFWTGLLKILTGIGQKLGQVMLMTMADVIEEMKKNIPGAAAFFGDADLDMRNSAYDAGIESRKNLKEGMEAGKESQTGVVAAAQTMLERYMDSFSASGAAFMDEFMKAENPFDTSEGEFVLNGFIGRIKDTFAALKAERDAANAKRNTRDGEATGAVGGIGSAGAAASQAALNGRLSQAVNTIAGRNAYSVMAASAQKTEQNTAKTAKAVEEIAKNTKPTTRPYRGRTTPMMSTRFS